MANVVHVNTFFVEWGVCHVISLGQDTVRSELLLSLSESVGSSASSIDGLGHAGLSLPVSSGAHGFSLGITVEIGALTVLVTTAKDAGLELSVLGLTRVDTISTVILTFHRGRFVNSLLLSVSPVTVS